MCLLYQLNGETSLEFHFRLWKCSFYPGDFASPNARFRKSLLKNIAPDYSLDSSKSSLVVCFLMKSDQVCT